MLSLSSKADSYHSFPKTHLQQESHETITKMPQPSIRYIEDLSKKDTEKLTQLLNLGWRNSPSLQWLSKQEQAISSLPSRLRKSDALLPRLAMSLPGAPQKAVLCSSHKQLNPYLIHRLFFQLSAECTTRLTRLVENPYLPENLVMFLKRIHSINSLWMSPTFYHSTFRVSLSEEAYERLDSGCEACILAIVGSNDQMLSDLRASMLGRRKRGLPVPRLLKVVDAWIEETGRGDEIRKESDVLGKEIRGCRRQMQKARRQKRRNAKDGVVDQEIPDDEEPLLDDANKPETPDEVFEIEGKEKDESVEHDFENSIFDYYASASKTNLASNAPAPTLEDIHPAFRNSMMTWSTNTGTFHQRDIPPSPLPQSSMGFSSRPARQPSPQPPRAQTPYTASLYSRDAFGSSSLAQGSVPDLPSRSSDEHARAYRKLMGIDEDGEAPERRRTQDSKLSAERVTRWMDFSKSGR